MNDPRVGPLLAQENLASYRPLGAFGRPVYESYLQIRSILGTRLGSRYANYFARPNLDQSAGTVRWTADVDGPVRHWSDMPPEEQTKRALELETIRAGLEAYVRELRAAPEPAAGQKGESPRAFASLLEQAVVIPSARHLHFVGDQPVATFWGFQELSGDGLNALALRPPPRPAVPPAFGAAAPAASVANGGQFPWWLLWLLFGLLAILFLLFAWWRCWLPLPCPAPAGFSIEDIFSGQQQPETPPPDGNGVVVVPGGTVQGDGTIVPGGTVTTPADGSAPATGANDQTPPGDQPKTPEDPNKPKDDSQQPKADSQQPQDQQKPPENGASKKNESKDKDAQTNPPKPLDIPPEAAAKGDVGFMDGQWRSGQGLVDQADGKPLDQYYNFDKNGKGEVVVKRADGTECKAPAQAKFNGKNLTVEEIADVRCADGRTYGKSTTTCTRDAKGNTVCRGKNPDGTTYAVPVHKMP